MSLDNPIPEQSTSPGTSATNIPPQPLRADEERMWGMLAHLSVLVNLVTGFGGPLAALVIYLVYKDRSRFVGFHALQSLVFQLIGWYGGGIIIGALWAVVGILSSIFIGVILIPIAIPLTCILGLLPIGTIIYGIIAAVQINQGKDFRYWLIGDWLYTSLNR